MILLQSCGCKGFKKVYFRYIQVKICVTLLHSYKIPNISRRTYRIRRVFSQRISIFFDDLVFDLFITSSPFTNTRTVADEHQICTSIFIFFGAYRKVSG